MTRSRSLTRTACSSSVEGYSSRRTSRYAKTRLPNRTTLRLKSNHQPGADQAFVHPTMPVSALAACALVSCLKSSSTREHS